MFSFNGGVGTNEILNNPGLTSITYDSLTQESQIIEGTFLFSYFQPISPQTTLLLRVNSATKQTENLTQNQAYRIGGISTIRGFDEQSIFASSYAIGTLEYRLLFDKNAHVSIFCDWAWYELRAISDFVTDTPYALGAGITFGTQAGIFSLNYALGSQFNQPINFQSGKIHFGFINLF